MLGLIAIFTSLINQIGRMRLLTLSIEYSANKAIIR